DEQCIKDINYKLADRVSNETNQLFSFFIRYYFNIYDLCLDTIFVESYIDRMIYKIDQHIGIIFIINIILSENIYANFSRTYLRIVKNVYINTQLTDEI